MSTSTRIHVRSNRTSSWSVSVGEEEQAIFAGVGARARAVEAALRLAEELRTSSGVIVLVQNDGESANDSRVVRSRLAS